MTHHVRDDIPYQFALADAFTICDNYHCSVLGPTDPNRYHMWTGWVGNDGKAGGPVITNAEAGYDWSTYPERLERAGISWFVYQDAGLGLDAAGVWGFTDDPYIGNFGDNSLLYFHQYQNAQPGNPLADKAKIGTAIVNQNRSPDALLSDFRADVQNGTLPQVSWIVAPEAYTEHPNWEPDFGAWYVSQVVDILASNPEIWSKMVLFVTYDEDGGFFDHMVSPTPPQNRAQGLSTAPTTNEIFAGDGSFQAGPYGVGVRVPMIVVSPWTRGGWVNSQLFDHTSLIRFLETRFGRGNSDLIESNITPWRRAVVGDLTSTFDFRHPNRSARVRLPDTSDFKPVDLVRFPDEEPVPPTNQEVPDQERGVRPARAIPYTLFADGQAGRSSVRISLKSSGGAAAVFHVRSTDASQPPRSYTVESGKQLADTWNFTSGYDLSVYGPNGFFRHFRGSAGGSHAGLVIQASYGSHHDENKIVLTLQNPGSAPAKATVSDRYSSRSTALTIAPGGTQALQLPLNRTRGWYDLTVTLASDGAFEYRYSGHLENGEASISDPGMGGLI